MTDGEISIFDQVCFFFSLYALAKSFFDYKSYPMFVLATGLEEQICSKERKAETEAR